MTVDYCVDLFVF